MNIIYQEYKPIIIDLKPKPKGFKEYEVVDWLCL